MSVGSLSGEQRYQYPRDVGKSRHSIFQAADKAYEWYPRLEKRGGKLEVFREELEKRVQTLAHERIESQEALLKEGGIYKKRQQFFQVALEDVQRLVEVLRNLDTGFDGLQPLPEKDPKTFLGAESVAQRQHAMQNAKKIANAKMHLSILILPPCQLQRKMEASLKDVKSLLRRFKQITNGEKSQESESDRSRFPIFEKRRPVIPTPYVLIGSTLDEQLPSSFFSSSSSVVTLSSPPFPLKDVVYEDIASMNQQLELQELRHRSHNDDFDPPTHSTSPLISSFVPPIYRSSFKKNSPRQILLEKNRSCCFSDWLRSCSCTGRDKPHLLIDTVRRNSMRITHIGVQNLDEHGVKFESKKK